MGWQLKSQGRNFYEFKFGNVLLSFKFSNFISEGTKYASSENVLFF